jgi:hypothetical protein
MHAKLLLGNLLKSDHLEDQKKMDLKEIGCEMEEGRS